MAVYVLENQYSIIGMQCTIGWIHIFCMCSAYGGVYNAFRNLWLMHKLKQASIENMLHVYILLHPMYVNARFFDVLPATVWLV